MLTIKEAYQLAISHINLPHLDLETSLGSEHIAQSFPFYLIVIYYIKNPFHGIKLSIEDLKVVPSIFYVYYMHRTWCTRSIHAFFFKHYGLNSSTYLDTHMWIGMESQKQWRLEIFYDKYPIVIQDWALILGFFTMEHKEGA